MEQKSKYVAPSTQRVTVELEQGFMSNASVFDPANQQDDGVKVEGHEVGNTGVYDNWDFQDSNNNSFTN